MPNHITNRLVIKGDTAKINEVLDFIKIEKKSDKDDVYGKGTIDFNKITPMPKWIFRGNLRAKEMLKYGKENCWYRWSLNNWGTKWNAYAQRDMRSSDNVVYFTTAWNGVPQLISRLAWIFPDVTIEYSFADEEIGCNVAKYVFKETSVLEEYTPDSLTKDAFELAFDVYGVTPDEYNMVYDEFVDNYVYIEDDEEEEE